MAIFDTETERRLNELVSQASQAKTETSTGTAGTTEVTPGPASPYAALLEQLAQQLGTTGGQYADRFEGEFDRVLPNLQGAAGRTTGRADEYGALLDSLSEGPLASARGYYGMPAPSPRSTPQVAPQGASGPTGPNFAAVSGTNRDAAGDLINQGWTPDRVATWLRTRAPESEVSGFLAGAPAAPAAPMDAGPAQPMGPTGGRSQGVIDQLYETAKNPIDDELTNYFKTEYMRDVEGKLAAQGFIGQGRGVDLTGDALNKFNMGARDTADARRINSANAARGLATSDLDEALRNLTAGTSLATGSYGARDAAEKEAYNYDLGTLGATGAAGATKAGLQSQPSNLWTTLYGMDTARLSKGVKQDTASQTTLNGETGQTSSGSTTGTSFGSTSPGAQDTLGKSLDALAKIGGAVQGVGSLASGVSSIAGLFGF